MGRIDRLPYEKFDVVGSNQLICGIKDVETKGSRVQLDNIRCREVTIIAKKSNTGSIFVGDENTSSEMYGVELHPNESFTFFISNLSLIHIDASVDGEGISYVTI